MLVSLRLAGMLDNLAALLVGGFDDMKEPETPYGRCSESIIAEVVEGFGYPVFYGFPAGHRPDNVAICMGRNAEISLNGNDGFILKYH
jgi:muramoyltetrapeptide carboxypeptidase